MHLPSLIVDITYIYISHGVSPLLTLALIQDRIMNPSNAFVLHRLVGPGYWNMLVFGAIKTLNAKRRCKVFAYSLYIYFFFFFSLSPHNIFLPFENMDGFHFSTSSLYANNKAINRTPPINFSKLKYNPPALKLISKNSTHSKRWIYSPFFLSFFFLIKNTRYSTSS